MSEHLEALHYGSCAARKSSAIEDEQHGSAEPLCHLCCAAIVRVPGSSVEQAHAALHHCDVGAGCMAMECPKRLLPIHHPAVQVD